MSKTHNFPASSVVTEHPSSNPHDVATGTVDPAILTSMAQRPVQGFNLSTTQLNIYVGVDASPEVRKAIVAGDYVNLAT